MEFKGDEQTARKDFSLFKSLREGTSAPADDLQLPDPTGSGLKGDPITAQKDLSIFGSLHETKKEPQNSSPIDENEEKTFDEWCEVFFEKKLYHSHGGFKRLVNKLITKGYSKDSAVKIAGKVGVEKFGKKKFKSMAKQGKEWHAKHEGISFENALLECALQEIMSVITAIEEDMNSGPSGGSEVTQSSNIGPYKRSSVPSGENPDKMNASQKNRLRKLQSHDTELLNHFKDALQNTSDPQVKSHLEKEIARRESTWSMMQDVMQQ